MNCLAQKNDGTNDIYMDADTNQLAMAVDKSAYAFILADAIRTLEGEIQLSVERGIPYMRTVFDSISKIPIWAYYCRKAVLGFDFVKSIDRFDYSVGSDGKTLSYSMTVSTDDGEVVVAPAYSITPEQESGEMGGLIQDGKFYLPVFKTDGVQYYRILTDYTSSDTGTTTSISDQLYIKVNGVFVEADV